MLFGGPREVEEALLERRGGLPLPLPARKSAVHHDPGRIEGTRLGIGINRMPAEPGIAPRRELRERHAATEAPAKVLHARPRSILVAHLTEEQCGEIARMQTVAHLITVAAEADVFQWPAAQVSVDPEREDALVVRAELASAGQHAAAVDPHGDVERMRVFERNGLAGGFAGAIERHGWRGRKRFARPGDADSDGHGAVGGEAKRVVVHLNRQGRKRFLRIDAAGAEKNEPGAMTTAVLQDVDRAPEIVLEQLTRARPAVDASEHARVRRGIDDPVGFRQTLEI